MGCRGARVEAGRTAGRRWQLSRRTDGGLDQHCGGGNGQKSPTGGPCSALARFLTGPCHQSVLTNLQYMEACPHVRALLASPLPGKLFQTVPVPWDLSEVVCIFCIAHSQTSCFSRAGLFSGPRLGLPSFLLSCFLPLESKCFVGIC